MILKKKKKKDYFLINQLIVWSIKCQSILKNALKIFPESKLDVFKLLILFDQQSQQQYSLLFIEYKEMLQLNFDLPLQKYNLLTFELKMC